MFEIYPKTRKRKFQKPGDRNLPHMWVENKKKEFKITKINQFWSQDFTHLYFKWIEFYLATVIDEFTKEIVWYSIWLHHEKSLILEALKMWIKRKKITPEYSHSD